MGGRNNSSLVTLQSFCSPDHPGATLHVLPLEFLEHTSGTQCFLERPQKCLLQQHHHSHGTEGTPKAPGMKAGCWAWGCTAGMPRCSIPQDLCLCVPCVSLLQQSLFVPGWCVPCELLRLSWSGSIPSPGFRKSGIFLKERYCIILICQSFCEVMLDLSSFCSVRTINYFCAGSSGCKISGAGSKSLLSPHSDLISL